MKIYLARKAGKPTFYDFFPKTVARDQGHSDPKTIYDTMLPQGVSTNQILDSYVNWAASKQNLSSGFQQSDIQTSLLSCRDQLENWNFALASQDMILFIKRIAKTLIRLRICTGWFAPLLFVKPRRLGFISSRPI